MLLFHIKIEISIIIIYILKLLKRNGTAIRSYVDSLSFINTDDEDILNGKLKCYKIGGLTKSKIGVYYTR